MDAPPGSFARRYSKLTRSLCEVADSFSLVSFTPLCITDPITLHEVLRIADKCNGYGLLEREVAELSRRSDEQRESTGTASASAGGGGGRGGQQQQQQQEEEEEESYASRMADLYSKYVSDD